jgi:hypothetical protein
VVVVSYEIDRYLRAYHTTKKLSFIGYITSKKVTATFLSQLLGVYETLRSFVWFTPYFTKSLMRASCTVPYWLPL